MKTTTYFEHKELKNLPELVLNFFEKSDGFCDRKTSNPYIQDGLAYLINFTKQVKEYGDIEKINLSNRLATKKANLEKEVAELENSIKGKKEVISEIENISKEIGKCKNLEECIIKFTKK